MCYPSVETLLPEELEVCADHVYLRVGPLLVGHDAMKIADVVVAELVVAPETRSASSQRGRREQPTHPGSWKYLFLDGSGLSPSFLLISLLALCSGDAKAVANSEADATATAQLLNRMSAQSGR